jgi:hypothetical protein
MQSAGRVSGLKGTEGGVASDGPCCNLRPRRATAIPVATWPRWRARRERAPPTEQPEQGGCQAGFLLLYLEVVDFLGDLGGLLAPTRLRALLNQQKY